MRRGNGVFLKRACLEGAILSVDCPIAPSVDRDDVPDQGAGHISETVERLKEAKEGILVEVLTPDFRGEKHLVEQVATSGLDVFAHNIETVERLTPRVRDRRAHYRQSLDAPVPTTSFQEISLANHVRLVLNSS